MSSGSLRSVAAWDALYEHIFSPGAYPIHIPGDTPAMAKPMHMNGHNVVFLCRAGNICNSYDPFHLPLCTHDEFIQQAVEVASAPSDAEAQRCSRATGINGFPVLAILSSLSFPDSFGHDLMHLIPENIVKNLIMLWTGDFKGIENDEEDYKLQPGVISAIGDACVLAGNTTPAAFSLVIILNDCLSMSIDSEYVNTILRTWIVEWVQLYKKFYYKYESSRLPVCTLTLHVLLHIPDNILTAGPIKSHKNLYASFSHHMWDIVQNNAIKVRYNLHRELDLSDHSEELRHGHQFPECIAVLKPHVCSSITPLARTAVKNFLIRSFDISPDEAAGFIPDEISQWGKISLLNGGNTIRAAELVQQSKRNVMCNALFLKVTSPPLTSNTSLMIYQYSHDVDKNCNNH
ncbi:hypothetical protein DFH08DRAFT_949116 [Mycena albidolilacea]|uniref:Uncharacterized protein n=1 Tax=Mycena albidolilacea TaxID=1033008 RepID=A0AAD7F5M8_9AGAR|nr:hypothetical protein DFH08DRAFT_949116 [Mycena albidolilacea]